MIKEYTIRKARPVDIKSIYALLEEFAEEGRLLARPYSELYDFFRDYFVAVCEEEIVGTCALHLCWEDLAEIRSLAVKRPHQGKGLGKMLVQRCLKEAATLEIKKIFVLTYEVDFFQSLGFNPISKSKLPHKVWSDCVRCIKFPECDEEALIYLKEEQDKDDP